MKRSLVILWLFMLSNTNFAQQQTLPPSIEYHIPSEITVQKLPPLQWILEEGESPLQPEELQAGQIKDASLIELSESDIFLMKEKHPYWIKLKLSSEKTQKGSFLRFIQYGDVGPLAPTFRKVSAYFMESETTISKGKSGFVTPASQRDIPHIFSNSILQLKINQKDTVDVWVKLISETKAPIQIENYLIDSSKLEAPIAGNENDYTEGMLIGALLALFILGAFLFYWFKETVYFWFLFLLIIEFVGFIFYKLDDQIISTFFPETPELRGLIAMSFVGGQALSLLQFGRIYINTKKSFPKIDRFLIGFLRFIIFMTVLSSFQHYISYPIPILTSIRNILAFFGITSLIGVFLYLFFSGNKLAKFYSFGAVLPWIGFLINNIIANLNLVTMIDITPILRSGLVITMTLALAYRFRLLNQQREKAQEEKTKQLQEINLASSKFVPSTFLNFLGKKNILDATLGDYVEKQVSVLFSDIRDYTTLSEQMTPEENFRFVNAFNKRMGPIIQKHKGFINQYLGDGIMAIFPKDSKTTLLAAIEMQQNLQVYNQSRISKKKTPIRMGIGLHAGPLIMGIIGDEQRMDAATISDTVNAASRIESLTKHFGVNILLSGYSYKNIEDKDPFNLRYLGKVLVKGKHHPVALYECFDGDTPDQIKLKKQTLSIFEKGLQQYLDKNFANAVGMFTSVLNKNPKDAPAKLFLEKAAYLTTHEIEENWTGVEKMEKK